MKNNRVENAENVIRENGGVATSALLHANGIDNRLIAKLVASGTIDRVQRGVFQLADVGDSNDQFVLACSIVPSGVVALLSALEYHQLTTFMAREINLAIPRSAWAPKLPVYPPMKLTFFSDSAYSLGITTLNHNGGCIRIYDPEKTVCDIFRYRHKLGQDIALEAIKEYMRRKPRSIQKLMEYAKILRIDKKIRPFLEALV